MNFIPNFFVILKKSLKIQFFSEIDLKFLVFPFHVKIS